MCRKNFPRLAFLLPIVASIVVGLSFASTALVAQELVTYNGHIRKIFKKHCAGCHNSNRSRAGLDLTSYASVMRGSDAGEVLVGGDPEDSYLYLVTAHEEEPAMPPGGKRIPEVQLDLLKRWIEGGLLEKTSSQPTGIRAEPMREPASEEIDESPVEDVTTDSSTASGSLSLGPVYQGLQGTASRAIAANSQQSLIAVGAQLQVLLFDADSNQLKAVLPFPEGEPQVLQFSPEGTQLLAGGGVHAQSGSVVLWDTQTGERKWEGGDEFDVVMAAALSPDGKRVVFGGPERIIKVLSTESATVLHRIEKHTDWVLAAAFSPDGLVFATADRDGGVYLWETESGELIHSFRGHQGAVSSIGFHSDQDTCFTASEDGTIRTWNLHTGKQVSRTAAHKDGVLSAALSPSGGVLSVGRDMQCKACLLPGKTPTRKLDRLPIGIAALDGSSCVLSLHDGTQTIWNYAEDSLTQLAVPQELLTSNLAEVIPANFVAVRRTKSSEPITKGSPSIDSDLLRLATNFELRLQQANEKIPSMTQQVGNLRDRIRKLEQSRRELEEQLQSNLTELDATEGELKALISELSQLFELTE